ncbi:MAG TPA: sugar phosphate isomerase/epimerase [Chloroflexota bacterium]|jgi:sugar phosphate isomerase/epimerase|nr:sugar phosphate isomerase/epimerase [Chloroflexota bacterium]
MPNHVIVSTLNWSENSLEKAVANVAALEFGQIDLALHEGWAHLNPSDLAAGGADRVRRESDRLHALIGRHAMKRVSAFNVGLGECSAEEQTKRLQAVCDLARALDVTVLTLMAARWGSSLVHEADRLRRLLPVARERGVLLTVQTHREQVTAMADAVLRLCELAPGLGVTLDASHLHAGPNRGADYSALLPHVRLVHLRDATRDHLQVPAGAGEVDFRGLVTRLHQLRYEGKFAIKYVDRVPTVIPAALPASFAGEPSTEVSANVLRMRDLFVAAEKAQGIVRAS